MRLVFSEAAPDYKNYIFSYAIWAFPEIGEVPKDLLARGFLPSGSAQRYYLCRSVRVDLAQFRLSSENRRILKKGQDLTVQMQLRSDFELTPAWREFCLTYAEARFGAGVMSERRLADLFASELTTHILIFRDEQAGRDVGLVVLGVDQANFAQYQFAFYALDFGQRSLGLYMMTVALQIFRSQDYAYVYLGSCYSEASLYKTQYHGVQWFDGVGWSTDLAALKYVIARDGRTQHLLESQEYLQRFHQGDLAHLVQHSPFKV